MMFKKLKALAGLSVLLFLISGAALADPIADLAMTQFQEAAPELKKSSAPGSNLEVVRMVPTFLFEEDDGHLLQWASMEVENHSASAIDADVSAGRPSGLSWSQAVKIPAGKLSLLVKIPDLREPAELDVTISAGGHELASAAYDWPPARQWTVYITHLSHFDWGYTGTQEQVRDKWDKIISTALKFTHETDDYPDDAKFRYTLDAGFPLQMYLERYPDRADEITELVRSGRWDVNAKFAHLCPSTTSPEILARELYYSKRDLEKMFGVELPTAIHTDVPGITWGDADVLAGGGVKYLLFHPNIGYRGAAVTINVDFPHAYYWQGPGGGKVLMWRSFGSYVEATFLVNGITATAKDLPALLLDAEEGGYPYDVIHFTRSGKDFDAGGDDNSIPRIEISESIRDWNSRFAYPRLIMDTPKVFFADLEKRYGDKIPTAAGDMPDWWADGILTDAKESGQSRIMHNTLKELELWASAARLLQPDYDYPARDIAAAYLDNYLFDEHTWGSFMPLLPPENEIFKVKSGRMIEGLKSAELGRARALYTLARMIGGDGGRVVVFNPLGWTRSEAVRLHAGPESLDAQGRLAVSLKDVTTGETFPSQIEKSLKDGADAVFEVKDVPAFGWRTYTLVPLGGGDTPVPGNSRPAGKNEITLENDFFKARFERGRGGLVSLYDKRAQKELIDPNAKYALGQLVARKQGWFDLYDVRTPARAIAMSVTGDGPVYASVTVKYLLPTAPFTMIENEYRLYKDRPYLDLTCALTNYYNGIGAAKYIVFPFAAEAPEVKVEIPFAEMRPGRDQLPGYAPFYAVSDWVNIAGAADNIGVTWSPLEGPMVEFGAIQKKSSFGLIYPDTFDQYPIITDPPYIFSELMNNYQNTNYHYEQKGTATWRYRISSHPADMAPSLAGRAGKELGHPLIAVGVEGGSEPRLPDVGAIIEVSPDSVTLVTLKRAEDGNGLIARLYQSTAEPATATLRSPLTPIKSAAVTDIVEKNDEPVKVANGAVEISLPPFSIRTVRLEF